MNAFAEIRAQDVALGVLQRAMAHGRLASAYLFEGPSGVGKRMAAIALAKTVLGEKAWPRIDHGSHPDVRTFLPRDEGHRNIRVETLREEILPYAEFAPFEGKAAFLIFPEADVSFPENHAESANALLKSLEEPKANVTWVLLSERPERLLPTIRSRCQRLRFAPLPPAVVEAILVAHEVPEDARPAAIALADGRADRALRLCQDGEAAALLELAMKIDEAVAGNRPGALVHAAEELARHDDLLLALDSLCLFYRDVAAVGAGLEDGALRFGHVSKIIRARARHVSPRAAAERIALVQRSLEDLEGNAAKQSAMDALLHRMRAA